MYFSMREEVRKCVLKTIEGLDTTLFLSYDGDNFLKDNGMYLHYTCLNSSNMNLIKFLVKYWLDDDTLFVKVEEAKYLLDGKWITKIILDDEDELVLEGVEYA